MKSLYYGFDIETKPLIDRLDIVYEPYAEYKPLPSFDPANVKVGNLGEEKKKEKIAQAEKDYAIEVAEHAKEYKDKAAKYRARLRDEAALNPLTGAIVVIGVIDQDGAIEYLEGNEKAVIEAFWERVNALNSYTKKWLFWSGSGNNSNMFDIDFIVTRSRCNGIQVPSSVRNGRFYSNRFVDLAKEFLLYKSDAYMSLTKAAEVLDLYARHKDISRKKDDDAVTGKNFHKSYAENRELALLYLKNDLKHLQYLADIIL